MKEYLSRREFLKLTGLLSLGMAMPPALLKAAPTRRVIPLTEAQAKPKNILIVVYDALSAHNIPLYGYGRDTMPNLSRLAERAVVYHNHWASGNFTTPGTASMLTGVYPWTHRAFSLNETVDDRFLSQNIYQTFPKHHRLAYTHNPFANTILRDLVDEIDDYIPPEKLFVYSNKFLNTFFSADDDMAYVGWLRTFESMLESPTNSLFLARFIGPLLEKQRRAQLAEFAPQFPRGVPYARGGYFLLEDATDYLAEALNNSPTPFSGYFHFLPPHHPYSTRRDFHQRFRKDGFSPPEKPKHYLSQKEPVEKIAGLRSQYDEYLLYVDHEFNRLYSLLEKSGVLEDTWLIFTSDHGEMFERGTLKHTTITMYQPVLQAPMLIFEPGRRQRKDIYVPTNGVDLLPTLLQLVEGVVPDWCEGAVMPPYNLSNAVESRSSYSLRLINNGKYSSLKQGSIAMVNDFYKLVYYFGYKDIEQFGGEMIELYDLKNDPEEMQDLALTKKALAGDLLAKLKAKLVEVNQPYI